MPYKNIKHIFFDLDHTLWDFEKNSEEALTEIIKECQSKFNFDFTIVEFLEVYKPINKSMWDMYRENKIKKKDLRIRRFSDSLISLGITSKAAHNYVAEEYVRISPTKKNLLPNAITTLSYLSKKYKLHIITNGFEEIQGVKLKNSNIDLFFDKVITSESIGVKKPDPLIFSHAMDMAKTITSESIMIGDDYEADVLGAIKSGIKAIYFYPNTDRKIDVRHEVLNISDLNQLVDIL